MLIGYIPYQLDWNIDDTHGATMVSDDNARLTDGMPSLATRYTWNSDSNHIVTIVGLPDLAPTVPNGYFCVIVDNVSLPVGTEVTCNIKIAVTPTFVTSISALAKGGSGKCSVCFVFPPSGPFSLLDIELQFFNTSVAPSTVFDVGEIWCGPMRELNLTAFDVKLVDNSIENRAALGQARKLFDAPYRITTATLSNRIFSSSFETNLSPTATGPLPVDLQNLLYGLSTTAVIAIVPRYISQESPGVIDNKMVNSLAQLVTSAGVGSIKGNANEDMWPATLTFNELL